MQTKKHSLIESIANVAIGYTIALLSQVAIFPQYGIAVDLSANLQIGAWFTIISIARSYTLRRIFNRIKNRSS